MRRRLSFAGFRFSVGEACAAALALALPLAGFAIEVGEPAPAITQPALAGDTPHSLGELKGKVVLVDFWASWCSPCLKSLPLYEGLRQEFARADFEILAVNVDEDQADAKAFLETHKVSYPVVHDGAGVVALAYGLKAMPSSYLIDRSGRVHARHAGFKEQDLSELREQVRTLVAVDAH